MEIFPILAGEILEAALVVSRDDLCLHFLVPILRSSFTRSHLRRKVFLQLTIPRSRVRLRRQPSFNDEPCTELCLLRQRLVFALQVLAYLCDHFRLLHATREPAAETL
ncbi:hypothetical protein D3C87_1806940 [compost metagenome]